MSMFGEKYLLDELESRSGCRKLLIVAVCVLLAVCLATCQKAPLVKYRVQDRVLEMTAERDTSFLSRGSVAVYVNILRGREVQSMEIQRLSTDGEYNRVFEIDSHMMRLMGGQFLMTYVDEPGVGDWTYRLRVVTDTGTYVTPGVNSGR